MLREDGSPRRSNDGISRSNGTEPWAPRCTSQARPRAGRCRPPLEAIIELRAVTALGPAFPGLLQDLGQLLRAEGRPEEAAQIFQKAATPDPRHLASFDGKAFRSRGTPTPIEG